MVYSTIVIEPSNVTLFGFNESITPNLSYKSFLSP